MPELKPCPFCGGKAEICPAGRRFRVECMLEKGACAVIPITWDYDTKEEAADAWNRRYSDVQE